MGPTRALWVPFPLGRPFGVVNDPEFQTGVVRAALKLLETATGPTIEDYPIEMPNQEGPEVWACPISLPRPEESDLARQFRDELDLMTPWQQQHLQSTGRSAFGMSGATLEQLDRVSDFLIAIAEGAKVSEIPAGFEDVEWRHKMPMLIRHAAEDMRAYYQEALAAQPNMGQPTHAALNTWIFNDTALGKLILEIGQRITDVDDARYGILRGFLIPEGFWKGEESFGKTPEGLDPMEFAIEAQKVLQGDSD